MSNAQRTRPLLFQKVGLWLGRGRLTAGTRRPRTALYRLVGVLALCALGWLTGAPQHAFQMAYVWLAYPAALVLSAFRPKGGPGAPSWDVWTQHADVRYALLAHTGVLNGLIALEAGVLLAPVAAIVYRAVWFVYTRPRTLKPSTAHGSARWMTTREMRALAYRGSPLMLGRAGHTTVALDRDLQVLNVLLVGPPNTGKSAGFIIPNLLRERGERSLVVTDMKGELLTKAGRSLAEHHDVWLLDFLAPQASRGYNPLAFCTDHLATTAFCDAWIKNTGSSASDPFWDNAARELLYAGIVHLQACTEHGTDPPRDEVTLTHLDHFLCGQSPEQVASALGESPSPVARKKAGAFLAAISKNEKLLGSVFAEITPRFMLMGDERVQAVTSRNEIDFARMVTPGARPVALFLRLDRTLQEQLKPLIAAFFLDMFRTFSQLADLSEGDALPRDVFVYADEFGNLGAIPAMATWMSTMRSAGVGRVLAVQSTKQIEAIYGPEHFETITGSCYTKIGLSHMGWADAKWFSDQAGQKTEVTQSSSVQRGRFHVTTDRGGAGQSETKGQLINPDEVHRIAETEMIALIGERPPARLQQRRYFTDPDVASRAAGPLYPLSPHAPLKAPKLPRVLTPLKRPATQDASPDRPARKPMLEPASAQTTLPATLLAPESAPLGSPGGDTGLTSASDTQPGR